MQSNAGNSVTKYFVVSLHSSSTLHQKSYLLIKIFCKQDLHFLGKFPIILLYSHWIELSWNEMTYVGYFYLARRPTLLIVSSMHQYIGIQDLAIHKHIVQLIGWLNDHYNHPIEWPSPQWAPAEHNRIPDNKYTRKVILYYTCQFSVVHYPHT